jgi:hypothetical protein
VVQSLSAREEVSSHFHSSCDGAGGGNRTPVTSLENWDNSRYTTPADQGDYSNLPVYAPDMKAGAFMTPAVCLIDFYE